MEDYVLETLNLSKRYKKFYALNDVNMHVRKGDIYGFVGKNGAGKTTLIRIITGVAEKTTGKFFLFGEKNPQNFVKSRAKIGAVVENPAIALNMNAHDNLMCQCTLLAIPEPAKKIQEVMDLVGLTPLLDQRKLIAKDYSLGMRQRLGIAMALISDPEFLMLDEPTNGLDPEGIKDMRELLTKLSKEKKVTILISSHILGELSKLATCYGFIDHGRLIEEISAEELEKRCQKAVVLAIQNPAEAIPVLEARGMLPPAYEVIEKGIRVFGEIVLSDLIVALAAKGIIVHNIHEQNEDLEGYFMTLIGGTQHD